jgi:hypothetical protein
MDFSDNSLLDFRKMKGDALNSKEYSEYVASNRIESNHARKLVQFFIDYDRGLLMPEKCDAYEPIREKFSEKDISGPLRWISQPGGALYLKRTTPVKYEGRIENRRFAPIWKDGSILRPKVMEPRFLSEIMLHFEIGVLKAKANDYVLDLIMQLARVVSASYGFVTHEDVKGIDQLDVVEAYQEGRLPGVFWINYLGADYISMFKRENVDGLVPLCEKFVCEQDLTFMVPERPDLLDDKSVNKIAELLKSHPI